MNTVKKTIRKGLPVRTHRWQWMAGAAAATLANVTAAQAADVTVPLIGNYISASGGNHLNADLTGDGHPSFFAYGSVDLDHGALPSFSSQLRAKVWVAGVSAAASFRGGSIRGNACYAGAHILGSPGEDAATTFPKVPSDVSVTAAILIIFNDPLINGGATTPAELEVTTSAGAGFAEVQLDSYTYDQTFASTVPEQTSTLALLALGAGGVLAFRQRRQIG